ncbi:MAG: diguanylate cyclase [Rhodocyclaceae bacterium]|nr:diguanylate cyclase [Rhodocyclaceae bacterium]MBX3667111.1 diguanylate cyclase [Rhodocyclaceae bacterium]
MAKPGHWFRGGALRVRLAILVAGLCTALLIVVAANERAVISQSYRSADSLRALQLSRALAQALMQHGPADSAELLLRVEEHARGLGFAGARLEAGAPGDASLRVADACTFDEANARHECSLALAGVGKLYTSLNVLNGDIARAQLLNRNFAAGALVVFAFALFLGVTGNWLLREVRELERCVGAMQNGEASDTKLAYLNDEVGALARAVNLMAQSLDERVAALTKSERRFHAIADYTYGIEAWFSLRGRLIWINRSIERVTGYTPLECILADDLLLLFVPERDRKRVMDAARSAAAGNTGENFELRLQRRNGACVWVTVNWQPIYDEAGENLGLRLSAHEIQSRKEAELKMADSVAALRREKSLKDFYLTSSEEERRRLEALLDVMRIGVLFVDQERRVQYSNRAFHRIWGIDHADNLSGLDDASLLARTAHLRCDDAAYCAHVEAVLASPGASELFEFTLADGRIVTDMSALVLSAAGEHPIGRVWIFEDVTEQRRTAQQLVDLAERDALTGLLNRRRFEEELRQRQGEAERRGGSLGLMEIDLDGFKPINDEFGHQAGDQVLVRFSDAVARVVRKSEIFFRIGGDEFAVLAPDCGLEAMQALAQRILTTVDALVFTFQGREVRISASLGIAMYPLHAADADQLARYADSAMYAAKQSGKHRWSIWKASAANDHLI